jgi:hydroxylamine dehydrogenase
MTRKNAILCIAVSLLLGAFALPLFSTGAAEEEPQTPAIADPTARGCIDCHGEETPNILADWKLSKHARNGVDCSVCHGDAHTTAADAQEALIPNPDACAMCRPRPPPRPARPATCRTGTTA